MLSGRGEPAGGRSGWSLIVLRRLHLLRKCIMSTRILGRCTAPFPPFLTANRVPHGFTPKTSY